MAAPAPCSILFVFGAPHSGTTLIGRMLAMHPRVLYLGEALRLADALATEDERCSCEARLRECPFWGRWVERLPRSATRSPGDWDLPTMEAMRVGEGAQLLIDSSKSRAYRLRHRWRQPGVRYLVMVRDPRGSLRAGLRDHGSDLDRMLHLHRKWVQRYADFAREEGAGCCVVFYEELMASTEAELRRVCAFLGLDFDGAMLNPAARPLHLVRTSESRYLKGEGTIVGDERWRHELSAGQTAAIEHALGRISWYRGRYFP